MGFPMGVPHFFLNVYPGPPGCGTCWSVARRSIAGGALSSFPASPAAGMGLAFLWGKEEQPPKRWKLDEFDIF